MTALLQIIPFISLFTADICALHLKFIIFKSCVPLQRLREAVNCRLYLIRVSISRQSDASNTLQTEKNSVVGIGLV